MPMSSSNDPNVPNQSEIRDALRHVIDPEVGVNIVDPGLVYRIDASADGLRIDIAMTSPACPMSELILDDVRQTVDALAPEGLPVNVELVCDPPWQPARMNDAPRRLLDHIDADRHSKRSLT